MITSAIAASRTPITVGAIGAAANPTAADQVGFISGIFGSVLPADGSSGWDGWDLLQLYGLLSATNRFVLGWDNNTAMADTDAFLLRMDITGRFGSAGASPTTMTLRRNFLGAGGAFQGTPDGGGWVMLQQSGSNFVVGQSYACTWYHL